MAEKKEVVAATANEVVPIVYDSEMLSQGTGLEEAGVGDYAIPFLRVLQSMSPQLKKSDGQYIQGAEEGPHLGRQSQCLLTSNRCTLGSSLATGTGG